MKKITFLALKFGNTIYINLASENFLNNYFLELFSSDPDNMSNSKNISKFNNFLNEIKSKYICLDKLDVNEEGEIMWVIKKVY